MRVLAPGLAILTLTAVAAGQDQARRADAIHERVVFADIHAHPSRFHRANVDRIDSEEIARYRRGLIDVVVCNVSSDAAHQGGYTRRDGTNVPRLQANDVHPLKPGEAFAFTLTVSNVCSPRSRQEMPCSPRTRKPCSTRSGRASSRCFPRSKARTGSRAVSTTCASCTAAACGWFSSCTSSTTTSARSGRRRTTIAASPGPAQRRASASRIASASCSISRTRTRARSPTPSRRRRSRSSRHTGAKALHSADRYLTDDEIRRDCGERRAHRHLAGGGLRDARRDGAPHRSREAARRRGPYCDWQRPARHELLPGVRRKRISAPSSAD